MDKEYLKLAAQEVEQHLPDNHGFILLVAPFGDGGTGRCNYISTMTRPTAINLIKEFLIKCGHEEDWMKHIK